MGTVVFDYAAWAARYPELAGSVTEATATAYFNEAGLYCDNSAASIIADEARRSLLLNMLTAHIAAINSGVGGSPASPLVGRISNATEGSVSVQAENLYPPGTVQWYQSTKYGAAYWAATAQYRTMRYIPSPPYPGNPPWPF